MRVLITGGCGYLGAAVTRLAVERGHRVLNIDRRRRSLPTPELAAINGRPGYARLEADIGDRSLMRALFQEFQPERVIHLAAASGDDLERCFDTDIGGVYALLDASRRRLDRDKEEARAAFRFVYPVRAALSAGPDRDLTPREASARARQAVLEAFARSHGVALVSCVADEVIGPGQPSDGFLPKLMAALLAQTPIDLDAAGETARDWLPLADYASGLLRAAERGKAYRRYEFTCGAERSERDLADAAVSYLDAGAPHPDGSWAKLVRLKGDARAAAPAPALDPRLAESELGWAAESFHVGLQRAFADAIRRFSAPPSTQRAAS